ncbi:branched-chain amino acid ABC transporter permease [Pusillimonas sp. CC-YST705]|uniref:Branched-chain amino acid ABC transporter permease n=1 Tax=Mesopusillimonas faecipullorum TaxID=2755040 RepID=A0ABS8CEH4_9BURK|nr:branched-chain amino acid ABC transporter permease [Mesopusillimonas faecipullorum]MCB5364436.1 branched-chain amino acid ABC transporter permease [Mesopusillimonas faecipullorum]
MNSRSWMRLVLPVLFIVLAAIPFVAQVVDEPFYVTFFARVLIYALAACALNIVLGFAGLVSFGHAMFIGLGCYAVGILSHYGISNGWIQLFVCIAVCIVVAVLVGSVCLRTSGIGFIMITLAFSQMFYFLMVSLTPFGGDDGLNIYESSNFGWFELSGSSEVYWATWALLLMLALFLNRLRTSPFGMVLRATHINPRRVDAFGYSVFRIQLSAYVLSGVITGIAGFLLANLTAFAVPSYIAWHLSGELIVMIVIGGIGLVTGPIFGAIVFLVLEEVLKGWTTHWMLVMGPIITIIALAGRNQFAWLKAIFNRPSAAGPAIKTRPNGELP